MTTVTVAKKLIQIGAGADPALGQTPQILFCNGVPDNSLPLLLAPVGSLCCDTTAAKWYVAKDSAGTWGILTSA